jgi:transposase
MSILSIDLHSSKSMIRLSFHFQNVTYGPAMSPDLNPIEHIWDMLGRRIQTREPHVQNIRQLETALHRE